MKTNNTQELTFKEKLNKPIVKFGCLPLLLLFIIFMISIFTGNDKKIDFNGDTFKPETVVKDFCTMSLEDLEKKYGTADNEIMAGEKVYNWTLNKENNIKVSLFYSGEKREVARFFGMELGTYFWTTLGWDKGTIDIVKAEKADYVRNLNGIEEAIYKYELKTLNVKLTNDTTNFGKL